MQIFHDLDKIEKDEKTVITLGHLMGFIWGIEK